jgi:hypothetical protein
MFPCKNLSPEYGDAFMVGKSDVIPPAAAADFTTLRQQFIEE